MIDALKQLRQHYDASKSVCEQENKKVVMHTTQTLMRDARKTASPLVTFLRQRSVTIRKSRREDISAYR